MSATEDQAAYQARVEVWLGEQTNLEDGLIDLFKRLDAAEHPVRPTSRSWIHLSPERSALYRFAVEGQQRKRRA